MTISNAHLAENVQVWDGFKYSIMPIKEAKKLVKQGLVQLTANITAGELKPANGFEDKAMKTEPSTGDGKKVDKRTKAYKTRQMKAQGD